MSDFQPGWLPTMVGSVPIVDPQEAWALVLKEFSDIPAWPQLPRRTFLENMYVQYSERFPGIVLEEERIYVDRTQELDPALESLYVAYLENDLEYGAVSPEYAAALSLLLDGQIALSPATVAIKGQVTGPVSWGLTVVDQDRRPVLYDEVLAEAVAKHLRLKASWQECELCKVGPRTIVFVDEPYMASFGSAFVAVDREQVIALFEEVFAGIGGLKGVHCCGNTDWSLLLSTSVDILNLDAYEYADALLLYPEAVGAFLARGGVIAWGIVPAGPKAQYETTHSLVRRLEGVLDQFVEKGVPRDDLFGAGMVTPACGLGSVAPEVADRVFSLTANVSAEMRRRYVGTPEGQEEEA
jgi:hypothetical protein